MKRKCLLFFLLAAAGMALALQAAEFSFEKAKRVDDFLNRIARLERQTLFLHKMTFSQDEFNSYLNLIYVKRYAPEVTFIDLELQEKNRVKGRLHVKLDAPQYDNIPSFLRDVDVRVNGRVECENNRTRYVFEELWVNGASFSPEVLDEVYGLAQVGAKVKSSIYDWFSLLPGLKKFTTGPKSITLYY